MENQEIKKTEIKVPEISSNAEETLKAVAVIILVLGLIGGVIMMLAIENHPVGITYGIFTILFSIALSSIMQVIANISLRLKGIQETMPLRMIIIEKEEEKNKFVQSENIEITYDKRLDNIKKGDKVKVIATGKIYKADDISENYIHCGSLVGGYMWYRKDKLEFVEQV